MLPFSLTVRCVTCEETFVVNDREQCGTIVACPHCRAMVGIPDPAAEVVVSDDTPPILESPNESPLTLEPLSPDEMLWRRRLFVTFLTLTTILVLLLLVSLLMEPPQHVGTTNILENQPADNTPNIPAESEPEPEPPAEIIPEVIIPEIEPPAGVVVNNVNDDAIDPRDRLRDILLQTPTPTAFIDRRDEITARLNVKVASLNVSDVAAIEVARVLASVANASITVAPSIAEQRITLHYVTPVSIAEVMQAAAKLLKSDIVIEWNQVSWRVPNDIEISTQEETASGLLLGWDAMQQPCTLDVFSPMPLEDFLEVLEKASGVRMLIDHAALGAASTPVHTLSGTVSCDGVTLDAALLAFLASLDAAERLTYRICGARLIEVTTVTASRHAAAFTLELNKMPQRVDSNVDGGSVDSDTDELPATDDGEFIEDVEDMPE